MVAHQHVHYSAIHHHDGVTPPSSHSTISTFSNTPKEKNVVDFVFSTLSSVLSLSLFLALTICVVR